jgi:hypothetical protein
MQDAMSLAHARRVAAPIQLDGLALENTFVRELPADPVLANVPRRVRDACYTRRPEWARHRAGCSALSWSS